MVGSEQRRSVDVDNNIQCTNDKNVKFVINFVVLLG